MPLPDAVPKPEGSNIYHQLNAIKLGDLTNEQYAIVYDPLFLNDRSEDELRRLALIGLARQSFSASSSGPIGETVVLNAITTVSGNKEAIWGGGTLDSYDINGNAVAFPKGSVWQLAGASIYGTGFAGNVNHDIWIYPSTETTMVESKATLLTDVTSTAGNIPIIANETAFPTVFIDDTVNLWIETTGTFTNTQWSLTFSRVR
tara:strand:+ start:1059 stop:1667 length:609 start_codon:yes stop_codon:yes gene_type:complete